MKVLPILFMIFLFDSFKGCICESSVSLFPIFLIDKVPLRFFYHFFLSSDKKDQIDNKNLFNITFSARNKITMPQYDEIKTQYYFLDEKTMHIKKYDIDLGYSISGNSQIFVLGSDLFFENSMYYCSIDIPITWYHEKIHTKSVKYISNQELSSQFFYELEHYFHHNIDISNIDIMFGVDQWKGKYFELGYYFLLTTPNIIGPACAFEYRLYEDDTKIFFVHIESLFQLIPFRENTKNYLNKGKTYLLSHTNDNVFYTESIINLICQFGHNNFNVGYSFITQKGKRSPYLIYKKSNRVDADSFELPRSTSSQWLSVWYGGYLYETNNFNFSINISYDSSVEGHATPSFYDFVLTFGYEF